MKKFLLLLFLIPLLFSCSTTSYLKDDVYYKTDDETNYTEMEVLETEVFENTDNYIVEDEYFGRNVTDYYTPNIYVNFGLGYNYSPYYSSWYTPYYYSSWYSPYYYSWYSPYYYPYYYPYYSPYCNYYNDWTYNNGYYGPRKSISGNGRIPGNPRGSKNISYRNKIEKPTSIRDKHTKPQSKERYTRPQSKERYTKPTNHSKQIYNRSKERYSRPTQSKEKYTRPTQSNIKTYNNPNRKSRSPNTYSAPSYSPRSPSRSAPSRSAPSRSAPSRSTKSSGGRR